MGRWWLGGGGGGGGGDFVCYKQEYKCVFAVLPSGTFPFVFATVVLCVVHLSPSRMAFTL